MLYITFNDQRKTFFPQQEVKGFINLNVTSEIRISSKMVKNVFVTGKCNMLVFIVSVVVFLKVL